MIKLFVDHNLPPAAFNFIEFATATDDLDGAMLVCNIQARCVIVARYLLG